ncbi:MAG: hypothetical protein V4544_01170 [Pseudomonadota bacterium]
MKILLAYKKEIKKDAQPLEIFNVVINGIKHQLFVTRSMMARVDELAVKIVECDNRSVPSSLVSGCCYPQGIMQQRVYLRLVSVVQK